ncbi:hypothetical protein M422DRAFT_773405 [Sphaerobolus stellatus SS14]|nr:hypothetical protein M422DRAFT_773405 [Sphaerobolus stellatus SS14]
MLLRRQLQSIVGLARRYTHDAADIRNIAVVAHIDSGKTTLTESILLKSHYLSNAGSVDTGSTTTDFLPAERERGITIQSASIPVKWDKYTYNLVDTPGHADFGMEVESASRVVDGAVVLLDSVEGVEAQTKGVWRQLDRYNVPTRMMFFNKVDRPGASLHTSFLSVLANRFHPQPLMLTIPVASFDPKNYAAGEPGIEGVVDLVNWQVSKYDPEGESTRVSLPQTEEELISNSPFPPDHPLLKHLLPARTQLLESLSMHSDDLMSELLSLPSTPDAYLTVPPSKILPELRKATLSRAILPILCGSALKHVGTDILLDYIGALLASPLDVPAPPVAYSDQVQLLAWKVVWDKRKGWMTFVRVYTGTLKKWTVFHNVNQNQKERVSKILLYANDPEEVDSLPAGSIGVLLGLRHTRTGDTLTSVSFTPSSKDAPSTALREIVPPPAVVSASVLPLSYSDLAPVQEALENLTRTDPSARVDEQEGQILLFGLGALHLEILEGRLRDEYRVQVQLGKRRVSYREGYNGPVISRPEVYETTVGGQLKTKAWAKINFIIRGFEEGEVGSATWGDNIVVDANGVPFPSPEAMRGHVTPLANLVSGISSTLSNSHFTGLPRTHLHITVKLWELSVGAPPYILASGAAHILRGLLADVGMGPIMEPFVRVKVEVSEEILGKVVKDLTEHRGEILDLGGAALGFADPAVAAPGDEYDAAPYSNEGLYVPPGWLTPCSAVTEADVTQGVRLKRSIKSVAPLSEMLDYSNRLRALSGGHGTCDMSTEGYREVGETRKIEILRELGRA